MCKIIGLFNEDYNSKIINVRAMFLEHMLISVYPFIRYIYHLSNLRNDVVQHAYLSFLVYKPSLLTSKITLSACIFKTFMLITTY